MKIIISKSQWEAVGKKMGWVVAQTDPLQPIDGVQTSPAAEVKFRKSNAGDQAECRWCGKPYTSKNDDDGFCCDTCAVTYFGKQKIKESEVDSMKKEAGSRQMDVYKSIRKDMPPPEQIIEDDKGYVRQNAIDVDSDMPTINDLINEATVSCEFRGHKLGKWVSFIRGNRSYANNKCEKCGKEVQVIDRPLPNEIDIGGEAVALSCE